ncbi:hypothetical protein F383_09011 [Gossypium arboreum]|nr:hypothetical protein F383_38048 [Gossypium arboreum]KHG23797.1 hypothetical protein F383_09011 [Gossypium arboreum]
MCCRKDLAQTGNP